MPRIIVVLTVQFDADSPDQEIIDLALDQVLVVQPSCKIISKRVAEIDGIAVGGEDPLPLESIARGSRFSPRDRFRHGVDGDTYRPDYSDRGRDQRFDSYRPGSSAGQASSSRAMDSYRPNEHVSSSNSAIVHPDRQKVMTLSEKVDALTKNGELPPIGHHPEDSSSGVYGTRYDALIEGMVFTPAPQSSTLKKPNRGHRGAHYSPPPRRDRSASPENRPRRSDRLRSAATSGKDIVSPPGRKPRDDMSDLRKRLSNYEKSQESKLERWRWHREEDEKRTEAGPGSLEELAPKTLAKALPSERNKFEKQQEKHGITEALRLKNLRSNQKIEKAKRMSDRQRWGGDGEVKQGARMDAVIDQIASFDFSAADGNTRTDSDDTTGHPPIQTRKKKYGGKKMRARGRRGSLEGLQAGTGTGPGIRDDEMQDVTQESQRQDPGAIAMGMAVDADALPGSGGNAIAVAIPVMAVNQQSGN